MVEHDFTAFDPVSQVERGSVCDEFFERCKFGVVFVSQDAAHGFGIFEIVNGVIDVAGELVGFVVALLGGNFGDVVVEHEVEEDVDEEVWVGVGGDGAKLETGCFFAALGESDDGRAVVGGDANGIGGLEVGVETSVTVDGAVGNEAEVAGVIEDAVDGLPSKLGKMAGPVGVIHEVFAVMGDGEIGVHSRAVDFHHGFGEETCGESIHGCDLAGEEFV